MFDYFDDSSSEEHGKTVVIEIGNSTVQILINDDGDIKVVFPKGGNDNSATLQGAGSGAGVMKWTKSIYSKYIYTILPNNWFDEWHSSGEKNYYCYLIPFHIYI